MNDTNKPSGAQNAGLVASAMSGEESTEEDGVCALVQEIVVTDISLSSRWVPVYLESIGNNDRVTLAAFVNGCGQNFGLIPACFTASQMMNTPHWVKVLSRPSDGEAASSGIHYETIEPVGWTPAQVTFVKRGREPLIAVPNDSAHSTRADHVVLSNRALAIDPWSVPNSAEGLSVVGEVKTPTTPSTPSTPSPR